MRPARGADSSAVLVVPNVKVRVKAEHSTPPLSLYDLLGKFLPLLCKQFPALATVCASQTDYVCAIYS